MIWNTLYRTESFCDKGILKHLQNVIRHSNLAKKVKDTVRGVHDFYTLVTEAHIVAATMYHFNIPALDSTPPGITVPSDENVLCDFMMDIMGQIVNKYALLFTEMSDMNDQNSSTSVNSQPSTEDWMTNYASLVIGYGLMADNFHDTWKEGDGERLMRCRKFLLLHFRANGRTKYAVEAFRTIAQTSALLSPRKAHQLMWNRTCNPKGGIGDNFPLDLQNEFLNRDNVNTFPSNITSTSIYRSAQSVKQVLIQLQNNY